MIENVLVVIMEKLVLNVKEAIQKEMNVNVNMAVYPYSILLIVQKVSQVCQYKL